ncbi:MAG: hypothetical protein FD129_754, partial [bacterium]
MSASRTMVTPLFVALLFSLSAAPGASAGIADHPMILLHIDAPTGKNPCAPPPLRMQDVVTAAPSDPSGGSGYFVYVLVRNADSTGLQSLAGFEFGIEYEGDAGSGIQIHDWHHCGALQFPMPDWPASGTGNLITWDPVNQCQMSELSVAGYFYVTPYSPATMRLVPRQVSGRATVADCESAEADVYPRRLGWLSFGGAALAGDTDGFNPGLEPPTGTEPIVTFSQPRPGSSVADDDVEFSWSVSDDLAHQWGIPQSWQMDEGPWRSLDDRPDLYRQFSAENLDRGTHLLRVRALDRDGETGIGQLTFTTTVDRNLPPTLRLFGVPPAEVAGPTGLHLSWVGLDDRTPADRIRYRYSLTHTAEGDSGRIEGYADFWSDDLTLHFETLPRGRYRFQLSAVDDEGDESGLRPPVAFQVFNGPTGSPPSIWLADGPGFDEETSDPNPAWTARGHDDSTHVDELTYSWRWDGGAWSSFDPSPTRSVTVTTSGWHIMEARARDAAGLVSWRPERRRFRFVGVPQEVASANAPMAIRMISPNPSRGPTSLTFEIHRSGPLAI